MKVIAFSFFILINACLQNPINDQNAGPSDVTRVDTNDTLILVDNSELGDDVNVVSDVKSDPEMVFTPPNFPDPNRENKDPCTSNSDCDRISACMFKQCAKRVTGCGWFARPHPFRDTGCLLNKYGTGQEANAECETDSDCPSNMPNCILRMCQVNARCEVDSDCVGEQFCDYDTWCSLRAPCEGENKHCFRGRCEEDGLFCSYPSR